MSSLTDTDDNLDFPWLEGVQKFSANHYERQPMKIVFATGSHLFDSDNWCYVDMLAGYSVANFGHRPPSVVAVLTKAMDYIDAAVSNKVYTEEYNELVERLAIFSGLPQAKVLLMNTGAEGVETAIKIARRWAYSQKGVRNNAAEIIVSDSNFHGRTTTIIGFSPHQDYRFQFGPFTPGFRQIKFGSVGALKEAINENTAAFLVEPIQGEGGFIFPPEGYLWQVAELCREHNTLLILDEIPTAFGRTGYDLPHQRDGLDPDMVILGKALGGGLYPVSAVVARGEVMEVIRPGDHGSTFGGNALACAVGLAVLDLMKASDWSALARGKGDYFMKSLRALNNPKIKEVRGRGLFIGVELVSGVSGQEVCRQLLDYGVFTADAHGIVRFTPPLVVSFSDIDLTVSALDRLLNNI